MRCGNCGPLGAVYMAIHVAHGGGTVEVGELKRGPIELAVADDLLPGIERELMRLSRRIAFEDG